MRGGILALVTRTPLTSPHEGPRPRRRRSPAIDSNRPAAGGSEDSRKADHGAYGEIDPSGDDHKGLTDGGGRVEGEIAGDVGEVGGAQKSGRKHADQEDQERQRKGDAKLAGAGHPLQAAGRPEGIGRALGQRLLSPCVGGRWSWDTVGRLLSRGHDLNGVFCILGNICPEWSRFLFLPMLTNAHGHPFHGVAVCDQEAVCYGVFTINPKSMRHRSDNP